MNRRFKVKVVSGQLVLCLAVFICIFHASHANAQTGIDGDATSSSFTITGPVTISTLTATSLSVSTITSVSSATISNLSMLGNISMGAHGITGLANGSTNADAAAYRQVKILQVVSVTTTTKTTTTSNTFVASNLSVSITPSSSTSKILVFASFVGSSSNIGFRAAYTFAKNGSNLVGSNGLSNFGSASVSSDSLVFPVSIQYLDSPSTTSSTTYAVYLRNLSGSITVGVGESTNDTQVITAMEVNGL